MKAWFFRSGLLALVVGLGIGTAVQAAQITPTTYASETTAALQAVAAARSACASLKQKLLAPVHETAEYKRTQAALASAQADLVRAKAKVPYSQDDVAALAAAILADENRITQIEQPALEASAEWQAANTKLQEALASLQSAAQSQARLQQEAAERARQPLPATPAPPPGPATPAPPLSHAALAERIQQQFAAAQARQQAAATPAQRALLAAQAERGRQQMEATERRNQQQLDTLLRTDPTTVHGAQQMAVYGARQMQLGQQQDQQRQAAVQAQATPQELLALDVKHHLESFALSQEELTLRAREPGYAGSADFQMRQKLLTDTTRQLQAVYQSLQQPQLTPTQLAALTNQMNVALKPVQELLAKQQVELDEEAERQREADEQQAKIDRMNQQNQMNQ